MLGAKQFFTLPGQSRGDTHFRVLEWMEALFPGAVRVERPAPSAAGGPLPSVRIDVEMIEVERLLKGEGLNAALMALIAANKGKPADKCFPEHDLRLWRQVVIDTATQLELLRSPHNGALCPFVWNLTSHPIPGDAC